jgi:nitroreductase
MLELLRKRRSIRRYEDRPIETEKIELLKEAASRSPSSRSLNPWEFIFVEDPAIMTALAKAKPHGSSFLKGAKLGVIVCADPSKCDVWIEDCSIATILLQLTAQSLGLGSCWIQIRLRQAQENLTSEQYIRQLLSIPDAISILSIVAIGYPAEYPNPIPTDELDPRKIHDNHW